MTKEHTIDEMIEKACSTGGTDNFQHVTVNPKALKELLKLLVKRDETLLRKIESLEAEE